MRAQFIKSEFDGLLPGQYNEAAIGFGLFPGTWLVPAGMNDKNEEDPGKYVCYDLLTVYVDVANDSQVEVEHCTFLVDTELPGSQPSALEPSYISDHKTWEQLECSPFMDASRTHFLGRVFWVPDWEFIPARFRRSWGRHCLLQRRIAP